MPRLLRRRWLVLLAAGLAGSGALAFLLAVRADDPPPGRKYALLVGVRLYKKDELKNLNYTENDVAGLAQVLKDAGYRRVVLMTQSESAAQNDAELLPTGKNIRRQLQSLLEDGRPGDSVLVAFSGHGVQPRDQKGAYFCPMDADVTDRTTLVPLADVYKALEDSPAGTRLLLVDACRNDPLADGDKGFPKLNLASVTRPQAEKPPGGVAALFSCSEGQRSYESARFKQGVFFHYVIEGLKGEAANKRGEVTLERLAAYVKDETPDAAKDEWGPGARQRPQLVGDLSGEAPLAVAVTAAPQWAVKSPLPRPLNSFMAASIGGRLYVVGGVANAPATNLTVYDPGADRWTELAPLPKTDAHQAGRYSAAVGVIDDKLYLVGGWRHEPPLPTDTLLIYDPAKDAWTTGAPLPILNGSSTAGVIDGQLYVLTAADGYSGYRQWLHVYDPAKDAWKRLADAPYPHHDGAAGVIAGKFYVAGGGFGDDNSITDTLHVYDPATDQWSAKASLPSPRSGMHGGVVNGKLYMVGGRDAKGAVLNTTAVYDPAADRWDTTTPLPSPRVNVSVVAVGRTLFAVGGDDGKGPLTTLEALHLGLGVGDSSK